jgi:glycosyltransferase 2 family protein
VSALAVYFLLQQVKIEEVGAKLQGAQPLWLVLLVLTVLGSVLTRAARWQVYFLPERRVPFGPLFGTLSISYMASTFLPLRAGEVVRAVFLGQREAIPIPRVIGTILLEKLFDFLAIGVMLVLLVALVPGLPPEARVGGASIASVILLGFGFIVVMAIWREPTLLFVKIFELRLPFHAGERLGLEKMARQFAEGTDSLRVPRLWVPMLGWTALTWLCSLGTGWTGAAALGVHLELAPLVLALVLTSISQSVPSSPGYVGVYHAAVSFALRSFNVDETTALAIAVVTHAFTYGSLVVFGLIAFWTGGYSITDMLASFRGRSATVTASTPAAAPEVIPLAHKR